MSVLNISLSERSAKRVARLLANDTARRIMDAVSEESKSESLLAKELDIPLSTVHYNVQKLFEAGLLKSDEFTYSEKGKEVRHYALASEHIVISSKPSLPVAELLSGGVFALVFAAGVAFWSSLQAVQYDAAPRMMAESADAAAMSAPGAAASVGVIWPWVLVGALVFVAGALVASWWRR